MHNLHSYFKKRERGAVFLFIVFILSAISISVAVGFAQPNIREFRSAVRDNISNDAFLFAEAGNEDIYYRLLNGLTVPSSITYTLGDRVSTTTVTDVGVSTKEIETESSIRSHVRKSRLRVIEAINEVEILYGAQIGDWGAEMDNNAEIKGVLPAVGDIYTNGSIRGTNNSVVITGNAFASTNIKADNQASSTSCVQDQTVGESSPEVDFAQSFIASSTSDAIHHVDLYLKKVGNPSSRTVYIVADNAGQPDTVALTQGTLDRNKVTSLYSWISITFDTPVVLAGGLKYWVVLDANQHSSKYWVWCKDATGPYASGEAMYGDDWTSNPWVAVVGDFTFKTFYGEGESKITGVTISGDAHANTIENATVLGDAYYQTISGSSVAGTEFSGSPTPPQVSFPITEAMTNNWIISAEAGGTISGSCPGTVGCSDTMGPVKIDGDLDVSISTTLTVTGTIYVTGNFTTDNNVIISCDPLYAENSCVIVSEGYLNFINNSDFRGSGNPESFILLVSRIDGCLGVATSGPCGPGNSGIHHNNNASTGGIFFAKDSIAVLENNASVSSVVAKGVILENNAAIIYDTDLTDINVSSGPTGEGWSVADWREVE